MVGDHWQNTVLLGEHVQLAVSHYVGHGVLSGDPICPAQQDIIN